MYSLQLFLAVAIAAVAQRGNVSWGFQIVRTQKTAHLMTLHSWSRHGVSEPEHITVGICGAGAIAMGTAAILAQAGHKPCLWSPSGTGTADLLAAMADHNEQQQSLLTATGAIDVTFTPRIASTPELLVRDNDVIVIALPANGHKRVFDEIAPFLEPRHSIIVSSHASLGALYLSQILHDQWKRSFSVPITAWGTTVCTARKTSGTEVRINTVRQSVDLCTIPQKASEDALHLCQTLFPTVSTFYPRNGLLAISLSNLNPQNHLGIALGNMSRMEKGEEWYQLLHVTPNVGRFLEALDKERLEIAKALHLETKTIFEHFSQSFHVPISDSIADMNQEIHKTGKDVLGPTTADSRYVTEDVPFGLALTITLGKLVNRPAILHVAGLDIMSAMYGVDFGAENDLLKSLHLDQYTLEELCEAASTGVLRRRHRDETSLKSSSSSGRHAVMGNLKQEHSSIQ